MRKLPLFNSFLYSALLTILLGSKNFKYQPFAAPENASWVSNLGTRGRQGRWAQALPAAKESWHRSRAAAQACLEDERRMWDNPGTKHFLLWLSLDVKEKSAIKEVLAFPRRLSQRLHLTVNLYLHEDLYVCRHIHQ